MIPKADALQMQPSAFFLPMSYLVIEFAEITILFMEKTTILRRIGHGSGYYDRGGNGVAYGDRRTVG